MALSSDLKSNGHMVPYNLYCGTWEKYYSDFDVGRASVTLFGDMLTLCYIQILILYQGFFI